MMTREKEIQDLYRRYRAVLVMLNHRLLEPLPKREILDAAKAIGISRGEDLVLETEDELALLMDHCLYDRRREGKNLVERYFLESPPSPAPDERAVLTACRDARYSILRIKAIERELGAFMSDLLTEEEIFLADLALGRTAVKGLVFAGRIIAPDERFHMSTGGLLPVDRDSLSAIEKFLREKPGDRNGRPDGVTIQRDPAFSTFAIRTLLHAGASMFVAYEENPLKWERE